jgi:hypothetical protein
MWQQQQNSNSSSSHYVNRLKGLSLSLLKKCSTYARLSSLPLPAVQTTFLSVAPNAHYASNHTQGYPEET